MENHNNNNVNHQLIKINQFRNTYVVTINPIKNYFLIL